MARGDKFGYSNANDEKSMYRTIYLDGEDVSDRCYSADDIAGFVVLWKVDEKGNFQWPPSREGRVGDVVIVEDEAANA